MANFDTYELGGRYVFKLPVYPSQFGHLFYKNKNKNFKEDRYLLYNYNLKDISFTVRTVKGTVNCSFKNSVYSIQFEKIFKDTFYFTGIFPDIEMIAGKYKIPIKQWI